MIFFSSISVLLITICNPCNGHLAQLAARLPLPGTPARPGSPWPRPESLVENARFATISSKNIQFSANIDDCFILNNAFTRYNSKLLFRDMEITPAIDAPILSQVFVKIPETVGLNLCNEYPKLNTDTDRNYERYSIIVSETGDNQAIANITAWTVWGALRGIETFSQLIWKDENEPHFYVNLTEIDDAPRFPYRGFMLDTARHYVDLPIIQTVLDGMSYNKLNVFHWHIVDDQSFPFVSKRFPELSEKGAYAPGLTYEPEEVAEIIDYAKDRGIRVIFEFDTPGHTLGFGKAFPEILTPCFGDGVNPGTPNFTSHAAFEILDPTRNVTYEVMKEFFTEIKNVTKDEFVHLGMDEVYYNCWNSSPLIHQFMLENGMTELKEVQQYYTIKHLEMIKSLGLKSMIWQDPLDFGVQPSHDVLIQVWKGGDNLTNPNNWIPDLEGVLEKNYTAILSSCWYLNYISYGESWRKYYECDPIVQLPNIQEHEKKLIMGGEAAYWAEYADSTNFLPRIFPFVGPTAERLWSPEFPIHKNLTDDAMHRLDQHRCRMLWRGIPAQPIFNGYCFAEEKTGLRTNDNSAAIKNTISFVMPLFLAIRLFV